jgi:AbrB family looped-hinge helix DNA binding protein
MRITAGGQVTIPADIRERAGLLPGTEVDFVVEGETVRLVKAAPADETRGQRLVRLLQSATLAEPSLTTDEIMKLTRGE